MAKEAKEQVRAHFEAGSRSPLVIALPPGVGKSYAVAPLGVDFDIAWVSERHDMCKSVPALQEFYRHIERCHSGNCPDAARHDALAAKGRNTWPLHRAHACAYFAQHKEEGSAVYQVAHVPTAYPKQHEAIVTDELNLSNWLPERRIGYAALQAAITTPWTKPDEERLLCAVREVLTQAQRDGEPLFGKALFDALNTALDRRLNGLVRKLARDATALNTHPPVPVDLSLMDINKLPPVVVPYLLRALLPELDTWKHGKEWRWCTVRCRLRPTCATWQCGRASGTGRSRSWRPSTVLRSASG